MDTDVASNLLGSIPRGEEIHDPRAGDHLDAKLAGVELVQNSTGSWAIKAVWSGIEDTDGNSFEHQERFNIPTRDSDPVVARIFLGTLHSLELVPTSDKQAVYAETDDHREQLVEAFKTKVGASYPIRLRESNDGFLRLRFLKKRT